MFSNKREIISLHVSGFGNDIGKKFWSMLDNEYPSDNKPKVFYDENESKKFSPRAIYVQHDKLTSEKNQAYLPKSKNFFESYENSDKKLLTDLENKIRMEVEKCSCLEGFILTRSIWGESGSSVGSLVLEMLSEYDKVMKLDFKVYPSISNLKEENAFNSLIATYFAMRSNTDLSICLDSESLNRIYNENFDLKNPSLADIAQLSAYYLSSLSLPFRQSGPINGGLKEMVHSLVPFPVMNHVIPAIAPVFSENKIKTARQDTLSLTRSLFSPQSQLFNCGDQTGKTNKYYSCYLNYQGQDFDLMEIDETIQSLESKLIFADFSPSKYNICMNSQTIKPAKNIFNNKKLLVGLINASMITTPFEKLKNSLEKFIQSPAFLTKYSNKRDVVNETIKEIKYLIEDISVHAKNDQN